MIKKYITTNLNSIIQLYYVTFDIQNTKLDNKE